MKPMNHYYLSLFLILGLCLSSFTKPLSRWEKLGERKVNYTVDRDEIQVGARDGFFDALQIKVKRNGINISKMAVYYGNGTMDELEVREVIRQGGESRVIDLKGNNRIIDKVVFWYDSKNNGKARAVVELWGRH